MVVRIYEGEIHQGKLASVVRKLFVGEEIQQNKRKEADIKNPFTGAYLELDVWIPNLNICFEFQDNYHYIHTWYSHVPLDTVQQKDAAKQEIVLSRGISLILVPCWWDGSGDSLLSTIQFQRPDLLPHLSSRAPPTPLNPPFIFFNEVSGGIPDIGELMLASFPPLQLDFSHSWWLGEKYDGIRFCWHPGTSGLDLNPSFYSKFCNDFLDGELWFGRGCFPECQKIVNMASNVEWEYLRAIGFDNPIPTLRDYAFEARYSTVVNNIHLHHPFLTVIDDNGEGVVARFPKSTYEPGRSNSLFKLKAARGDKEALVVAIENGTVQFQMPDGVVFDVHKPNFQLQLGDIVTFTYERYSRNEAPVNPEIFRVRKDVSWEDIVRDENSSQSQVLTEYSHKAISNYTAKPYRYWSSEKGSNMRAFVEKFAKDNNFDPFVPEPWYSMSSQFISTKGAKSILGYFNSSYVETIMTLLPDIGLVKSKFAMMPRNYWKSVANRLENFTTFAKNMGFDPLVAKNWYFITFYDILLENKGTNTVIGYYLLNMEQRREIFEKFANSQNFDPFVAQNWYSVKPHDLLTIPGMGPLLFHYRGNFINALNFVFPEIKFDRNKFDSDITQTEENYKTKEHQREFFILFAKQKGIDPMVPESWYNANVAQIMSIHGAWFVLREYDGDYVKALKILFPEIPFIDTEFSDTPIAEWSSEDARNFFIKFSDDFGFSPLIPSNWYSVTSQMLSDRKGYISTLSLFEWKVSKALISLFPDIGLITNKFNLSPREFWGDSDNQREFFLEFAQERNFDPLIASNWYKISRNDITAKKNSGVVLQFYSGSYVYALLELFPNIGLDISEFTTVTRGYWLKKQNRKKFFDGVAQQYNFDPLEAANWYKIPFHKLTSSKNPVFAFYNGSYRKGLMDVYPNVDFDRSRFVFLERGHWDNVNNRKRFFDEFAEEKQFSPLVPANWYKVQVRSIWEKKSAASVLQHYEGNLMKALLDVYPQIGLQEDKFRLFSSEYWSKAKNRRKFFDDFAKIHKFDPLIAENWYNLSVNSLRSHKNAESVLRHYQGSLKKALLHLYPNIGLDPEFFSTSKSKDWMEQQQRKKVFVDFAASERFDPAVVQNWQNKQNQFISFPGAESVMLYYKGNMFRGLADVFPNQFSSTPKKQWDKPKDRLQFFEDFAKEKGFDSQDVNNWYRVSVKDIITRKVKRAIGKTSPLTPFEEFYAYCCADLMECLLLTVQTKLDNRKRPLSMDDIPVQLLVIATHLGQTKWHYWNSVREFTTLLDSPLQVINLKDWSFDATHKLYRNTVPLQRILRFSELFILPACLPNGGKRWYIGKSFEFASLSASYNLVSMRLQSIQQVKHISDIGDCYASVRKELYGELDITSDMVARLPELAILL